MNRYISLLRGINVGGHRKIKMAELRALYEAHGATEVASYIQSGNVVFSSAAPADALECERQAAIEARFGFEVPVIVRSAEAVDALRRENPFETQADQDPKKLVVFFATAAVDPALVENALDGYVGPEIVSYRAAEIVVWFADGQGRSRFPTAKLERILGCALTARNWKTLLQVCEMAAKGSL